MEVISYKCPCCAAPLVFDSEKQTMLCNSCQNTFTLEQVSQYNEMLKEVESESTFEWADEQKSELEDMNVHICPSCGAELVADENTATTECLYCGNKTVLTQKLTGAYTPDYIIPFKLDKDAAKKALLNFYKGKILLPKEFKSDNKLDKITGIYVPFWLFDCDAKGNIVYDATRTSHWSDSKYNYTKTEHYLVTRAGGMSFEKIPVDGSQKMDDAYMDAIEPFNYSELVGFNSAFLSGYLADKYDVEASSSVSRANSRVEKSVESELARTVTGYGTVTMRNGTVNSTNGTSKYALLPVWMLNTKYKDKNYTFAMNGQTGKLVGELPVDKGKFWGLLLGAAAVLAVIGQFFIF